jgi:hypothetical protein
MELSSTPGLERGVRTCCSKHLLAVATPRNPSNVVRIDIDRLLCEIKYEEELGP